MRFLLPLALLSACGSAASEVVDAPPAMRIACATGGATAFTTHCGVSQARRGADAVLTLSQPDGGFRRIVVDANGPATADGAEPLVIKRGAPGTIEIEVAGDRYRLPAAP